MPETDIGNTTASDMTNVVTDYTVDFQSTDGAGDQKETSYQNTDWDEDYGYYTNIPEFKTAVKTKAVWTVGGGYTADDKTLQILDSIRGNGKDSFNSILKNMIRVKTISKDSFAEIIRNEDGLLINLKPLDPSSIKIIQNRKGQIIRYEQVNKHKTPNKKFKPDEIFHLSHDRTADEIHGERLTDSLKWLIKARNEAMDDWKKVLHRNVQPVIIWHLDTDDPTEISAFKTKTDAARSGMENLYIPKGAAVPEVLSTAANATLNPLAWINQLNDYFFQAVNVPQIIIGNAKEFTDASGKIVYLSYEQSVKSEQLYVEEQVLIQLNIEIQLTFPASLQQDTISDSAKAPNFEATQPNDTTMNMRGQT